MKIIFKESEHPETPVFGDVKVHQFFVNKAGSLCHKVNDSTYYTMANDEGLPMAARHNAMHPTDPIKRILPEVERIEF